MLSGRITPTIYFGGICNSTSTLRTYCCIGEALIMPRSYYSSCAYSGYRPKTIGGTSLWASPGVSPDFSCHFCKQTVLRLICRGLHAVFIVEGVRLCHAAGGFALTATLITSGYAIILTTNMGGLTLCIRATTFVFGHFYQ